MKRKKILYISQVFPYPPDGGGKIKTLNTLKSLAKKYSVFAIFVSEKKAKKSEIDYLRKIGVKKIKVFYNARILDSVKDNYFKLFWNFVRCIPHYVFQYTLPTVLPYVQSAILEFNPEVVHIDHINMAQYLPKHKGHTKWILEHHNVEYKLLFTRFIHSAKLSRKMYLLIESVLTYIFERKCIKKFDFIYTISNEEEALVKKEFGISNVASQPLVYLASRKKRLESNKKIILFIGNLCWPPNEDAVEWFIQSMFPKIVKQIPKVEFHVIGKNNPVLNKRLPKRANIVFHGYKSDFSELLHTSTVFVMPIRMGAGVRIKGLTALSATIPIISTPLGVEGLAVKDGKHYYSADTEETFVSQTIKLLKSKTLRVKMSIEQKKYLAQYHSEEKNDEWLKQYEQVITQP